MKRCLVMFCICLAFPLSGCRLKLKHVTLSNLASVDVKELVRDDYASFDVQLVALDPSSFHMSPQTFPHASGDYAATVPAGRYRVILDYLDDSQKKIYSTDFCPQSERNNEVALHTGENQLAITVCSQDNAKVNSNDAEVIITPILVDSKRQ